MCSDLVEISPVMIFKWWASISMGSGEVLIVYLQGYWATAECCGRGNACCWFKGYFKHTHLHTTSCELLIILEVVTGGKKEGKESVQRMFLQEQNMERTISMSEMKTCPHIFCTFPQCNLIFFSNSLSVFCFFCKRKADKEAIFTFALGKKKRTFCWRWRQRGVAFKSVNCSFACFFCFFFKPCFICCRQKEWLSSIIRCTPQVLWEQREPFRHCPLGLSNVWAQPAGKKSHSS